MRAALRELIARKLSEPKVRSGKNHKTVVAQYGPMSCRCREAVEAVNDNRGQPHLVYLVKSGDFVKIGYTTDSVESRVASFYTTSPYGFEILVKLEGGFLLENKLHRIFKTERHRNEWFRYEGPLVEFVNVVKTHELGTTAFGCKPMKTSTIHPLEARASEAEKYSLLKECA